jgi:hypothetical protein
MKKNAVTAVAVSAAVVIMSTMILVKNAQADVASITDFRIPGLVEQVNALVNAVNGILDSSNKIDGEVIANDTIDDDSIDFADVTLADITPDTVNVPAAGVAVKSNNGASTNIIITAAAQVDGQFLQNDSVGRAAVGVIARSDTNETTVASVYVPDFVGQVLVGGAGPGTNAIWIANGATSNDWKKLTLAE